MGIETEESMGGSLSASGGVGKGGALASGKLDSIHLLGYTECFVVHTTRLCVLQTSSTD
jgi:hypothetical protein